MSVFDNPALQHGGKKWGYLDDLTTGAAAFRAGGQRGATGSGIRRSSVTAEAPSKLEKRTSALHAYADSVKGSREELREVFNVMASGDGSISAGVLLLAMEVIGLHLEPSDLQVQRTCRVREAGCGATCSSTHGAQLTGRNPTPGATCAPPFVLGAGTDRSRGHQWKRQTKL
mgnify:CR=1 FL=1